MASSLMEKLAAEEQAFMESEFFCPVMRGVPIRIRIAGITVTMKMTRPRDFEGWAVLKPVSFREAHKVRDTDLAEKEEFLKLFPSVRFVLCHRTKGKWLGISAHNDDRFSFDGMVPVLLPEEVQMFDAVIARFDGANFWFEQMDFGANAETPVALREALSDVKPVADLNVDNLMPQEREAYGIALGYEIANRVDQKEVAMKEHLRRGGAQFRSYVERGNTYTVEYVVNVDGIDHMQRSVVDRDTLNIIAPGICMTDERTGEDTSGRFDLQSLVGVIREAIKTNEIHRVGI
jgi:hypothetical protein